MAFSRVRVCRRKVAREKKSMQKSARKHTNKLTSKQAANRVFSALDRKDGLI